MTTSPASRPTFSFDDALAAIADYATALRSDSPSTDSTLDAMQLELDRMLAHDDIDPDDAPLDPDFSTFPSSAYRSINPTLADSADRDALADLTAITSHLFNLRP